MQTPRLSVASWPVFQFSIGLVLGVLLAPVARAFDLQLHAFGSAVGGEILSGDNQANPGNLPGPSFVADYTNGFAYTKRHPLVLVESRLGMQANADLGAGFSAVVQVVARTGNGKADLEWAYLSYDIMPNLTLQLGRKRLPIFYYSEVQDVGFNYPWVRPPGELYGWEVTNYDGAMLRFRRASRGWAFSASAFGGESFLGTTPAFKIYSPDQVTSEWNNIRGVDAELEHDWLTTRVVYIHSTNRYYDHNSATPGWADYGYNLGYDSRQDIGGWALNTDFGKIFTLGEANVVNHYGSPATFRSVSYSLGAGYRIGDLTPFLNYADYTESTHAASSVWEPTRYDNVSFTLRYDLNTWSDVKLQLERLRDMTYGSSTYGSSNLASASYDFSI